MLNKRKKAARQSQEPEAESLAMPNFFIVSPKKLIIMSLCTLGLYDIYWIYKQWRTIANVMPKKISPFWRTFFSIFFIFQLFTEMGASMPIILGASYLILGLLSRLPGPFMLIAFLSCVPLAMAQSQVNSRMNISGTKDPYSLAAKVVVVLGGIIFLSVAYSSFLPVNK